MGGLYETLGRKALFALDAERAHGLSIATLRAGLHPRFDAARYKNLAVNIAGLSLPNPLGMAAGYDKNADVADALLAMGFGHTEVGTVTPLPQPGNPKPRIFRLPADRAVINRLGFNSKGHDTVRQALRKRHGRPGIVGVNLGANKESDDFAADYVAGIAAFADLASYFTINISSPNTPGLRALQGANPLADLLQRVGEARTSRVETSDHVPVFLKIAPDLSEDEMDDIAIAVQASDIDALIVSNTTFSRAGLKDEEIAAQTGGLSGRPVFDRSTIVLAKMHQRLGKTMPLIGVGGIHDDETAWKKLEAGASLLQLYSALVYEGPSLPGHILDGLAVRLEREGLTSLTHVTGRSAGDWAARKLD